MKGACKIAIERKAKFFAVKYIEKEYWDHEIVFGMSESDLGGYADKYKFSKKIVSISDCEIFGL